MISFWRRPHARHDRAGAPRAAMRFPTTAAWTAPFRARVDGADDAKPTRSAPVPVAQLWTVVDGTADDCEPVYPREPVPLPPYEACWQGF